MSVMAIVTTFNRPWSACPASEYHAFDDREVPLNSHRVFTLLFAVVLVGAGSAQDQGAGGQEPPVKAAAQDARWWTSLSGDAKSTFLDGYTAAMRHVNSTLFTECADKMKKITSKITPDGRVIPIVPAPDAPVLQIWNLCVLAGSFDFAFEQRDLRNGVDEFYKDTQNSHVPVD